MGLIRMKAFGIGPDWKNDGTSRRLYPLDRAREVAMKDLQDFF